MVALTTAVRRAFDRYDIDGDGAISFSEMRSLLVDLGEEAAKSTLGARGVDGYDLGVRVIEDRGLAEAQLMNELDSDGSGAVEFCEVRLGPIHSLSWSTVGSRWTVVPIYFLSSASRRTDGTERQSPTPRDGAPGARRFTYSWYYPTLVANWATCLFGSSARGGGATA